MTTQKTYLKRPSHGQSKSPLKTDFNQIRIGLAAPEEILSWSHGEVTRSETINYRTLKPEKDGLFCEKIFGPSNDWECFCGKYRKVKSRNVTCDRCGVDVTISKVRRERLGHITLATPVAHIWYSKGSPPRLSLILNITGADLEKVIYYSQYIVINVDETKQTDLVNYIKAEQKTALDILDKELEAKLSDIDEEKFTSFLSDLTETDKETAMKLFEIERAGNLKEKVNVVYNNLFRPRVINSHKERIAEVEAVKKCMLLTDGQLKHLVGEYGGGFFVAGMGSESILTILENMDIKKEVEELMQKIPTLVTQRRRKAVKRLRILKMFLKSNNKLEWMIMKVLPVLPPELHPMVQLGGGRFATSDMNDLYRRVIHRNNRLRNLLSVNAPQIIIHNEKRMLQEAVDALIDNGRRGKSVMSQNHKLKSLTDLLRGKQGRFRQNLLGKRADYSGRSVIIAGPELKLHQCGLPRKMAVELYKPFIMQKLMQFDIAHNIKSAKRYTEMEIEQVWDILEDIVKDHPILLNRAPTLHRLGIQAFMPVLIDGLAIRLHPLVCTAFNADFDGDQMAVHLPLSKKSILEAKNLMISSKNLLAPRSGQPIVSPTLDIVLGLYFLTKEAAIYTDKSKVAGGNLKVFASTDELQLAYSLESVKLQQLVKVRLNNGNIVETTVGRVIFNENIPAFFGFVNQTLTKKDVDRMVSECNEELGSEITVEFLDNLKVLGFRYATISGTTIAISDLQVPNSKVSAVRKANRKLSKMSEQYDMGFVTMDEKYKGSVTIWTDTSSIITKELESRLPNYDGLYTMFKSGAKGNIAQIKQMVGMRGLMSDPRGKIIETPIIASFKEGLSVMEYFISTHGARKGLADTALRTADAGYLTRRLVDVAQDIIIEMEDCGTSVGLKVDAQVCRKRKISFEDRMYSRFAASDILDPKTDKVIVSRDEPLMRKVVAKIIEAKVKKVVVRSPLYCAAVTGLCAKCYGISLANNRPSLIGEAVGIIAAQAIGEPGTQLTMRTFHTGGIAELDITSGLPRVVELFEARRPRGAAILSSTDGIVKTIHGDHGSKRVVTISNLEIIESAPITVTKTHKLLTKNKQKVSLGDKLLVLKKKYLKEMLERYPDKKTEEDFTVTAPITGNVRHSAGRVTISRTDSVEKVYEIPASQYLIVREGDRVEAGLSLTSGHKSPQELLEINGQGAVQDYIIHELQMLYRSQGVNIHDKHVECIIRKMLRKVRVEETGNSDFIPGELIDRSVFELQNRKLVEQGKAPASAKPVFLGVTKASLATKSFFAAASFQETERVLADAAMDGAVDNLTGLKENVILGRLIPARLDRTPEGAKVVGYSSEDDKQETNLEQPPKEQIIF